MKQKDAAPNSIIIKAKKRLTVNVSATNGDEVGEYTHSVVVAYVLLFVKLKKKVPMILQPVWFE